ncbi:MAG: hypothetical protein GY940_03330 [bacterium]|nr:hypothetical protein [bacterium]
MKPKYLALIVIILLLSIPLLSTDNDNNNKNNKENQDTGKSKRTGTTPFSQTKFIPDISFILDFSYVRRNLDGELFEALETPGFFAGGGHGHGDESGHGHAAANAVNGFNLNYGELVLAAAVDPYFDLFTSFHLTEDSFEIEEAYVTTRRLPFGFRAKLGKFLSGFGRLNSQHAHIWDFADFPLVLRAFFGQEGMAEKGIQLNWTAPTDFYLALGIETLQGSNETSFGTGEFHVTDEATQEEMEIETPPLPNLWTFFGKTSVESGNLVILAGASYATGKTRLNLLEEEHDPHGFSGTTRLFGLDMTAKYIIDSYRSLALQAEYITRTQKGLRFGPSDHNGAGEGVAIDDFEKKQAGLYAQLVFRFHRQWRLGARWDSLNKNDAAVGGQSLDLPDSLNRYSVMMDYSPTEFSRIRLQYNMNRFGFLEDEPKHYNGFLVQFNLSIGAHGAHTF